MSAILLAWIYVLAMMALVLATEPGGSMFRAVITFLVAGFGPPALVLWLLGAARRRRLQREELVLGTAPDHGGVPPADPVAPERKEP